MSRTQTVQPFIDEALIAERTIPHALDGLAYPFVDKGLAELREGHERLRIFSEFGKKIISGFGSARLGEDSIWYQAAMESACMLAKLGGIMVTGGGPAIMEAWNRGGFQGNGLSFSCSISLPHEQESNPYVDGEAKFDYFYTRKILLMKGSHAIVCFPGGYGTLDELFEPLNLIQKGKMAPVPIVLYGRDFWQPHYDFLKNVAVPMGMLDRRDLALVRIVDSPQELVSHLQSKLDFKDDPEIKKGKPNLSISEKMFERARSEFNDAIFYLAGQQPSVSFSGSTLISNGKYLKAASDLGMILGRSGMTTLTSDTTSLTRALNIGVLNGGGDTIGFVNPSYRRLLEPVDPNLNHRIPVYYQFIREVLSHKFTAGTVLFPGGFGTLDRAFELLTLLQTKKISNDRPIIGYGTEFWKRLMDLTHEVHFKGFGTISEDDHKLLKVSDDLEEIADWLRPTAT